MISVQTSEGTQGSRCYPQVWDEKGLQHTLQLTLNKPTVRHFHKSIEFRIINPPAKFDLLR